MRKTLGLVSCTKTKKNCRCQAKQMYQPSDLFRKAYGYVMKNYDYVAMLSANYGLVLPDEMIDPYDLTLKSMDNTERKIWAKRVILQCQEKLPMDEISDVFFHSGILYRKDLFQMLEEYGKKCYVPLEGLNLGEQKEWYLRHLDH